MRIRKRQVPLPLSSLSPVPLSDPQFSQSPVVQRQLQLQNLPQEPHTLACFDSRPSDQPNQPIGDGRNSQDCSDTFGGEQEKKIMLQKDERGREGERGTDTRKGSLMDAEIETMNLKPSSSSRQGVGMWGDGEKAFPFKKRRRSFERRSDEDGKMMVKDKKMKNKKCSQKKGNNKGGGEGGGEEESKEIIEEVDGTAINNSAKKKARGGALMEGSRCSRVNGRGWRCCQQTLVGYSLCEHHLGKGRLRSMSSVRSRSMARTAPKMAGSKPLSSSSLSFEERETKSVSSDQSKLDGDPNDDDGDDRKPLMIAKKKLGTVKARSISSLLGQANYGIAVSEDSK